MAMAEVLFGDDQKAPRWLSKPKARFSGATMALLSTSKGTRVIEEMLLKWQKVGVLGGTGENGGG